MKSDNQLGFLMIRPDFLVSVSACSARLLTGKMMTTKKQDYGCGNYQRISREAPSVPKKGHFVVYVGEDHQRFVVPLSYLKSSIFRELLDEAAAADDDDQERGSFKNGIVLPCDVLAFQRVSRLLALSSKKVVFSF